MLTKVSPKRQVTIPAAVFKQLPLDIGDYIDVQVEQNTIILTPQKMIPKDQCWFWTKEWQKKEREAEEDIESGKISQPLHSGKALIKSLRSAR